MSLSIRNQIPATVVGVTAGEAMAVVRTRLDSGQELTAAITREAADELALTAGTPVRALVKSTEVALATAPLDGTSIRNQLPGTIARIAHGNAMSAVTVTIDGAELTAAITTESADELGLRVGTFVVALMKSTEISLATR
jgi:molybdate transport system regulatory protein